MNTNTAQATSTEADTRTFGRYTIRASRTTDGGYAINTFSGAHREDTLCLTTADRETYRTAYRAIAEGGLMHANPELTARALRNGLTDALHIARRRREAARVEHLNRALDLVADPAEAAAESTMVAGIAANIAAAPVADRPRTLVDLRNAHAAAVTRDRAARLVVA